MAHLIATYECEWKAAVSDADKHFMEAIMERRLTDAELIGPAALGLDHSDTTTAADGGLTGARGAAEQQALLACLRESGFNISEAARRLKISRVTVYRLCRKHGLVLDELR